MGENDHEKIHQWAKRWRLEKYSEANKRNIVDWKKNKNGFLPKKVWLNNLEIAGSYPCVEILPVDPKTGLVYLKKRSDPSAVKGELEWEGKLHIPGLTKLSSMRGETILPTLLKKEVLKDPDGIEKAIGDLSFLTQVSYPEPERKTVAETLELVLPIDPSFLQEDFYPVSKENIGSVIEQHRPLIEAYWEGKLSLITDTRPQ